MKSKLFLFISTVLILSACSDPLKGRIDINSITQYDKIAPEIDFTTAAGTMNGNTEFLLDYTLSDDNSGVAEAKIFYTPDFNTVGYQEISVTDATSTQLKFCVPNKNHPAPAFKIIAKDNAGNTVEKEIGTDGTNFSIILDTDPTTPTLTSSLGILTKDQPTSLLVDSCAINTCSGDAVYFETPTQTKYVLANTTGIQPTAGDANWVSCDSILSSGYPQNNFPSEATHTYHVWTKTEDTDFDSITPLSHISSTSSTIDITYDNTPPLDNTATGFIFDNAVEIVGDNIPVQWSLFTDQQVVDHRIELYTESSCNPINLYNSYTTSSAAITDNTNIDGIADGEYWAKVIAIDHVGLEGSSSCSLDSVFVDSTAPVDIGADFQFIDAIDTDGDDISVTWTAFNDLTLTDHRIDIYTNSTCTSVVTLSVYTGNNTNSDNNVIDGLNTGDYWATVTAIDGIGSSTTSACSNDTIRVDKDSPIDHGADLQFADTYETDGLNVSVSWTAFSDPDGVVNHKLYTYTNSGCSVGEIDHGFTSDGTNINSTVITGLADGQYWAIVEAFDPGANSTKSLCSSSSTYVDTTAPSENTTDLQFTLAYENTGNNIATTWGDFSDLTLKEYQLYTYTDSGCTTGEVDHGLTGSTTAASTIIAGLVEGTYYAKVRAHDQMGFSTLSGCSSDSITIDLTAPADMGTNTQFTNPYNNTGDNVAVSWTAFDDTYLSDHRLYTYTDSSCTLNEVDHGLTGSTTNSDGSIIDGLTDGIYYIKITAYDLAGNETDSLCSTDSITIDTTAPDTASANVQFTNDTDIDGNDLALTWTAATDLNGITDYQILTYTNSACSTGLATHPYIGSNATSDTLTVDGLADGTYYAKVRAIDSAGNTSDSPCSTDSIIVDSSAPVVGPANIQFSLAHENTGNNIAITWTAFNDLTLTDHEIYTYTDSSCAGGEVNHGLTGSTTTSSTLISGLAEGTYYAKVKAHDAMGFSTLSACSTDSIIIDLTAPNDLTANAQFTNDYNNTGDNIALTWTAFTDTYLSDYQIYTYTDSGCTTGEVNHGLIGGTTPSNNTIVDSLTDGVYYAKIEAIDLATNSTISVCSTDFITIDLTPPTENTADIQFTDTYDNDGNNIAVTWTAFTDTNSIADHQFYTYTDDACTLNETIHPLTGSGTNSDSASIDGLSDNIYYAKVLAFDNAGNSTLSACSSDFIEVDTTPPTIGAREVVGTVVTGQPLGLFNLTDCNDVTHVKITKGAGSPPLAADSGWQTCDTVNYSMTFDDLDVGANNLQFWIKDVADNVQPTFIAHQVFFTPPQLTVEGGPTINTTIADISIDYCAEAGITEVIFKDTEGQPLDTDPDWQACTTTIGGLKSYTLTPGDHVLKAYLKYDDTSISLNPIDVPLRYDPIINWVETPVINRPQVSFTFDSCDGISEVFVNQGTQPTAGDSGWQTCTTAAGGITHTLVADGEQSLNFWYKDTGSTVLDGYTQVSVNFVPPSAYIAVGNDLDTSDPALTIEDCTGISKVYVKVDDTLEVAPSVADFTTGDGQNCTTAMNAITSPTLSSEGVHTIDVWFYFSSDGYILDPWHERITVRYTANDTTPPPVLVGDGAATPLSMTLTNGDASTPPILLDSASRATFTLNTCEPNPPVAMTGTVDITLNTTTVTGTGTLFSSEISIGDYINIGSEIIKVASITNDTSLELVFPHTAGATTASITKEYPNDAITNMIITKSSTAPSADDTEWLTCSTDAGVLKSASLTPDGVYSLYAWFKDASGNVSTNYLTQDVEVQANGDTTPPPRPEIIIEGAPEIAVAPVTMTVVDCTDVDQIYLKPSEYPAAYVEPDKDQAGWQDCSEVTGALKYSVDKIGSYTFSAWYKDAAGNINPTPRDLSFIFNPNQGGYPDPIAYWTFDSEHIKEKRFVDAFGDNHLTFWDNSNITSTTGMIDEAVALSGTSNYILTKNTTTLKPTTAVTLSAWLYLTNGDVGTKAIVGNIEAAVGGYGFRLDSGNLNFYASGQSVSIATTSFTTGWHQITGSSDGRYINIYLDGELQNTTDLGAPANLQYGCATLFGVGTDIDCTDHPLATNAFDGKIDELAVWNKYLSEQDILNLYIDTFNQYKISQNSTIPADIASASFYGETLQNTKLTIDACGENKFIYIDETTHPPTTDTERWQICRDVIGAAINKDLIQGPHELKIWGKDQYNNITNSYFIVDTTVTSTNHSPPSILHYTMDNDHIEGSLAHEIRSGYHATNNGATASVAGIQNESYQFVKASNTYLETKHASISQITDEVTISIWADLTANDNRAQVLAGNRMSGHGYSIEIDNSTNQLKFIVETSGGSREVAVATSAYTTGFHNIIGTYDGQNTLLYFDGQEIANSDHGSVLPITYSCLGSFVVGAGATCNNGAVTGTHFDNEIDEVLVWDTALSATVVYELFNGQDTIPPLAVPVTPRDNNFTLEIPVARLNIDNCDDITKVYVALDGNKPTKDVANWQTCSTTDDLVKSSLLENGSNDLKVWFMDAAGNISDASTDLTVTYNYNTDAGTPDSYYTLDRVNRDGTVIYDVVGSFHGENYGPIETTGIADEGMVFNGVSDYIEVPYDASFTPSTEVTLSAWFKVASFPSTRQVIAGNYNGGGYELALDNGVIEFKIDAIGTTYTANHPTSSLTVGEWTHVVGIWNNGTIRLFINGIEEVNDVKAGAGTIDYAQNNSFLIGASPTTTTGASGNYFDGNIDEVSFYRAALSDTVVNTIYERQSKGDKAYYDVDTPEIPLNLNIIYYNSLVSRANLTVTDCTGLDYIIVTKNEFPPDKNDEDWQLCNTLTGGLLSKELDPTDNYAKFWTKDLFGNISQNFEYVPIVTNTDKPISRPVVHWTFDDAHYDATNNEALDRISRLKLKNEGYQLVLTNPGDNSCDAELQYDNTVHPTTASSNGVLNKSMLFGTERIMRVKSPENSKMKPTDKVSVAAWVYLTGSSLNDNSHIVSTEYNGKGWSLRLEGATLDDKGLRFTVHTAAGTLEPYLETKNYETGWHLVVGTYDGQKASLYFDGIFVKSFENASPSPIVYEAGLSAFVGSQASLGDEPTRGKSYYNNYSFGCNTEELNNSYFKGEIDEVIIWDTAISGLEASSLYHNGADILYETDTTEPPVPSLTLENTRPELYTGKAYFTVADCNDISGVLVNEGTRPDKQDDRWQVCRERRGSFGLENLSDGGHTITTWFKDLAGNVTSTSADIIVSQTTSATIPYANAYWPLDATSTIDRRSVDVIEYGVHDLIEVNIDSDSNPTAVHTTGIVDDAINLQGSQSYLTTKSTILLTPVNFLSVGGWFYLTNSDTTTKMYIDRHVYSSVTNRGGYALYQSGGQLRFKLELDIEGTINLATPMAGISTGWNYIVGTFTDQEVNLYVNGVQQATSGKFEEQDYVRYDINTDFRVGAESNQLLPATNYLNEKADEIQIWGYDLTASEVATSYTKGLSGTRHLETLPSPKNVDNAYIYFHSLYGPYAKMTLLNCNETPWIYVTYQGAPTPSVTSKDWHRCATNDGAILSEKLPVGTTYVDVYAKNAYGDISTLAGTKEIDPIPAIADYELVKPIYHASFNDGTISGTSLIHSPSQINATVSGSPTLDSSNEGGAYDFDGANDYITINNSFDFESTYNFTIATWAYINNAETTTRNIFTKTDSKEDIALFIDNGALKFRVNVVSPTAYSRSTDDIVLSYPLDLIQTGNNHIAVQYDGQKLYLYLNSNLVATEDPGIRNWSTTASRKVDFDKITGFYIGDNTTTDNHVGFIDDFMVFNQNLTEEQLYYHYKRYVDEVYPNDVTAPATNPNLSVLGSTFGTNWPSKTPSPLYTIDDCTDITGVYVTVDGAAAPTNTDTGWQSCNTAEGTITSPTLTPGVHTIYFWYRDARGNIAPAQSIIVEYTDPAIPQPIAYWTFDTNTRISDNYYDSSNQISMSSFGSNVNTSGKMSEGITTDGSRKYLKTNYDSRLKVTDEFTVGFWLDHDLNDSGSDNTDRVLSMRGSLPGGFELYVSCDSSSCLPGDDYFNFKINIDNADYVFDIPRDQFPSSWAYIIYSFDGRFLRFYNNGVLLREKDFGERLQVTYDPTEEVPLVIGAKPNEYEQISDYGELSMDDLAIWDKALNNAQITDLYNNYVNSNTRHFDPGLTVITPPDTRATIYNPGYKSFGSRLRITMSDCTNTNMILVSDYTVQPADDDENWQPCNTTTGGILSAPLPSGSITPRIWAKSFTGEVSPASGTANSQTYTMPSYISDIPRPQVHWSLDSATAGAYVHPYIYDNIAEAHGELDATSPPESTETSGSDSVIEKGFEFNGVDEFIKIKPDGNTNPMYTMSISAWAELEKGESSYRYIAGNIQNVESSSGRGVGLRVINGKLQFYISTEAQDYSSSGSNLFVELDTNIYNTGLHHVVGTFNGKKMELFLDGVKVAEKYAQLFSGGTLQIYHDDYSYWNIGADTGSHQTAQSGSFFRGVIDDIMIWKSVLTEEQVYYLYEYGSDLLPTTLADGIPPTDPGIEIYEDLTTTSSPWAFFTMPGCTGGNGILINAVYVNSAADAAPNKDEQGWQLCTEDEGYIISQLLTRGDNSVTVYFRDEEGDISSSTTFNVTYNPPELIQPMVYYNFNPDAQTSTYRYDDIVGKLEIESNDDIGTSSSVAIEGSSLHDAGTWHGWIDRSFSFEYDFVRDFTISFWHLPVEPGVSVDSDQEGLLLKTGQLEIKRTISNNIQVSIPFTTVTTPQSLIPEQWSHIVVKRENRTLNIYINGKLMTSARTTHFNLFSKAEQMSFGGPMGSYDELVFYDKPLTDNQIGYLFFKGKNAEQVDLMPLNYVEAPIPDHYWNFNNAQYTGSNLSGVTSSVSLENINGVTTGSVDSIEGEAFSFTRYEDILAGDGSKNTVGPRQFLRSDTVSPINLNSEFTMSMWLKMPNISDSTWHEDDDKMVIIDQWSPELAEQVFLLTFAYSSDTSGTYRLTMKNSNAILPDHFVATSSIDISGWHHLVIKRDAKKIAMFVNGREYGSKMITTGGMIPNNALSNPLRVGETGLSGLREIIGTVDITTGSTTITGTGTSFEESFYNYIQGQVSITAGNNTVTGTNTRFLADLAVGDNIIIAGETHSIASITDNTNLTLSANHVAGTTSEYIRRVLAGTVSITAGGTTLTGIGTDFTTAGFTGTSYVTFGNEVARVQSVDSATQITLAEPALITQTNVPIESTSYIKLIKLGSEVFQHYAVNSATTITLQDPHLAGTTASRMWVTKYQHNDEYGFDGSIDEFAVWSKALNFTQIYKLYEKGLANQPITTVPIVTFNGVGTTTNDSTIELTLSDCGDFTHVWIGSSLDSNPTDATPGWVACSDIPGALSSGVLTADSLNTIKVWFKTGTTVSSYTSTYDITHETGDLTPPTIPGITLETTGPTNYPFARFSLDSCNDINGVLINLTGITPNKINPEWKNCTTIQSAMRSPVLTEGANTISIFFKDEAGNVTTSSDFALTFEPNAIAKPELYLNFNTENFSGNTLIDEVNDSLFNSSTTPALVSSTVESEAADLTGVDYFEDISQLVTITSDLTISSWINIAQPATHSIIADQWSTTLAEKKFRVSIDNSGRICFRFQTVNSIGEWNTSTYKDECSAGKVDFGQWGHIAVTRSGSNVTFFYNSKAVGTSTIDAGDLITSPLPLRIGANERGYANLGIVGSIDETALWTTALNSLDIEYLYAKGIERRPLLNALQGQAPPLEDYFWGFESGNYLAPVLSAEIGGVNLTNIASSTPTSATYNPSAQIGEAFDYANENMFESNSNNIDLGTDFTISTWINLTDDSDDEGTILNKWNPADVDEQEFRLYTNNQYINFAYHATSTSGDTYPAAGFDTITSANQIPASTWLNIVVTRRSNIIRMYVNGSLEAYKEIGTEAMKNITTVPLRFGGVEVGGANFFTGTIDNTSIWKKSISKSQAKYIYQQGLANLVNPTTPAVSVGDISNTVANKNTFLSLSDCNGNTKFIVQDSALGAPAAATLTNDCSQDVRGILTNALPATANTLHIYLGDGTSTIEGPYPVNIIYIP